MPASGDSDKGWCKGCPIRGACGCYTQTEAWLCPFVAERAEQVKAAWSERERASRRAKAVGKPVGVAVQVISVVHIEECNDLVPRDMVPPPKPVPQRRYRKNG
jgi:hypothetical protein